MSGNTGDLGACPPAASTASASLRDQAPPGLEQSRSPHGADEPWTGSKKQREALRAMFDGRCAYCGNPLDKMHADHLEPCIRVTRDSMGVPLAEPYMIKPERNTVGNMMPACAACNLHKGGYSLESWRDILQRSAAILRRDTSTFRAGERFGIIAAREEPVVFYFERRGCDFCRDPDDGEPLFPMYGVAPHECYWRKGPEFTIGQSTLLPFDQWADCFVPELEDGETWADFRYPQACGVFYCPKCNRAEYERAWAALVEKFGPPPSDSRSKPDRAETTQIGSVHESGGARSAIAQPGAQP